MICTYIPSVQVLFAFVLLKSSATPPHLHLPTMVHFGVVIHKYSYFTLLQRIRRGNTDKSKIFFLTSYRKDILVTTYVLKEQYGKLSLNYPFCPFLSGALMLATISRILLQSLLVPYIFAYKTGFFSFQNNPKNLDPSYKMDLDLWDSLGKVKLVLQQNCIGLI